MTAFEIARCLVLSRSKLAWGWKLEPEQRLSVELADRLRVLSSNGQLRGIWFHVANEGKRHVIVGCILRAMGMHAGIADYVFIWEGGSLLVELKMGKAKQTPGQVNFQTWCEGEKLRYAVCWSVEEVETLLKQVGAI